MPTTADVISALNDALTAELTAVNQYSISAKRAADAGLSKLAAEYSEEIAGESAHAQALIERILFLDGVPNMSRLFDVGVGDTPIAQFELNYAMECRAAARYRDLVALCSQAGDPGSRLLAEQILVDEEHHVDEGAAHLRRKEQLGDALWLSQWV